jgi:serine/threonine-protein kinase
MQIIHRDIKPENVFLATLPGDEAYTGKVLDFGVAKFMQARGQGQARTRTGTIVGTPLYMSPEQVRGLKTIDHRTDIYSLGALTFTMLTGTLVFDGRTFGDLLFQICTEPLPKATDAAPWLPASVDDWFAKSCARAPEDRYQTVQEQVEALAAAVGTSNRGSLPETSSSPPPPISTTTSPAPPTASSPGRSSNTPPLPKSDSSGGGRQRVSVVAPTMVAFADIDDVPTDSIEPSPPTPKVPSTPKTPAAAAPTAKPPSLVTIAVVGLVLLVVIAFGAFYLGGRYASQPQPPAPSQPAP